ncbi:MAG TPA: hypothetical protein VI456_12900 [Polyangia bacterium]
MTCAWLAGCSGGALVGPSAPEVARIVVSASTNSAEVDVVVNSDGSAVRTIGPPKNDVLDSDPAMFPADSAAGLAFLSDLAAVGDVSMIPITLCGKSASFGTTTEVTAGGVASGDLQCIDNPTEVESALAKDCDTLAYSEP